jgi:anti-anti-sigma factor
MPLESTLEKLPEGTAVVTLSGRITSGSSLLQVDSQIRAAIANGVTRLAIDLTAVEYADSGGLGMLVFAYGAIAEKGGKMRVCGVTPRLLSLLKLTKTDTFLPMDLSRAESLAALAKG